MGYNPARQSTKLVLPHARYVDISEKRINRLAEQIALTELEVPSWQAPVFPEEDVIETAEFLLLGNAINFAYTDFDTGNSFATMYQGEKWSGAFGMWACLKNAYEKGKPLLDGCYLQQLGMDQMEVLFEGMVGHPLPLLEERKEMLNHVGERLNELYEGRFCNLLQEAGKRLFDDGDGLVDRLVDDFGDVFRDEAELDEKIVFNKRAQLAAGMVAGRFQDSDLIGFEDVDTLTVFADYFLPQALRELDVLQYTDELDQRIKQGELLTHGSREEIEIRAATIQAAEQLIERLNEIRDESVNALHIDYWLWKQARQADNKHHLTRTTAY